MLLNAAKITTTNPDGSDLIAHDVSVKDGKADGIETRDSESVFHLQNGDPITCNGEARVVQEVIAYHRKHAS